jgi:hydrogenase maturation protease
MILLGFKGKPGTVQIIPLDKISGTTLSTHTIPISVTIEIIKREIGAKVILIGLQPEKTGFGENLSPKLKKAAKKVAATIVELICKEN